MTKNDGYKLLERIKKDYTANVLLSQRVSKHLLYAMGDIENLLKELFTEMKNEDPSSLSIELKKIKWQDLAIKVFQEYSKIELYWIVRQVFLFLSLSDSRFFPETVF